MPAAQRRSVRRPNATAANETKGAQDLTGARCSPALCSPAGQTTRDQDSVTERAVGRLERSTGQRFVEGLAAAFLAVCVAWGVHNYITPITWPTVGVCATLTFALGWLLGADVIDFLKTLPK